MLFVLIMDELFILKLQTSNNVNVMFNKNLKVCDKKGEKANEDLVCIFTINVEMQ